MTESCPKKTNIAEISPHLICALCGGYLIDATTIVECLHSFCKTCIVRYLESSKYCPICEVLVHKTRPLQNIRLDHTLQDIVYKLVPGLFQSEMKRRREFYKDHPTVRSAKVRQEQQRHRIIYSADEQFSIALEFCPDGRIRRPSGRRSRRASKQETPERRYLLCPAGTTVALLKKFMKLKFALPPKFKVDIFHDKGPLRDHYSMMDVAYIYSWKREGVLQLYYTVYKAQDPVPEIRVTEVKDENSADIADDTGQKADDNRPSTLFNKATLLGNHSVDRNIPHDLSPLELIATVANDICIQEGRGLKRKAEDAQLYENDDESSTTETRQLQKTIERAIDLCSNSNQGSPKCTSVINTTVSATSVKETRTGNLSTVSAITPVSTNTSVSISNGKSLSVANNSSENASSKTFIDQKVVTKEQPKKTDTASQCEPRPKKHKGEGHVHSRSKTNKTQLPTKEDKVVNSINSSEKKDGIKSEPKVVDKSLTVKTNGVNKVEQNVSTPKSSNSHVGVSKSDSLKSTERKTEKVTEQKPGPKVINTPKKDTNNQPKTEKEVSVAKVTTVSKPTEVTPSYTTASNRGSSTVVKPTSNPSNGKMSTNSTKTPNAPVPNKTVNSSNKTNTTAVTNKDSSKLTSAQTFSKIPTTVLKSIPTPTKATEALKPMMTLTNGHSSSAEISKQQTKASSVVKLNQNEAKE